MTADVTRIQDEVRDLSATLKATTQPERRVDLIDRLLAILVYTEPKRARRLLEEQKLLLARLPLPDFQLTYYQHLAALDNLDYRFKEAETSLLQALELIEEYGTIQQRIDTCIDYSGTLINLNRLEEALDYQDQAGRLLYSFPDDELAARMHCRHAFIYLHANRYSKAIQKLLQAFNYLGMSGRELSLKGHYFYTTVNTGLGNVYERTGDFDKAIEAYQRTIDRCESVGLKGRLAWHYLNLGKVYLATDEYDLAGQFFSMVLHNEADASIPARAAAYANLGSCYIEQQRYREAEELMNRADEFYRNQDQPDYANSATIALWQARIRVEEHDVPNAIAQLEYALELAQQAGDPIILADICRTLAHYYAETDDYAAAYAAQLEYDRYQQQHQEQLNIRRQQELEAQFQTEAKEKEAERLKLKASQLQLKALRAQMNPHFL